MNRKKFIETYTRFMKSVQKLNKIAVRRGFSAMEKELEDLDFENVEDFRMGLRLLIQEVDPCIIDEIFTNRIQFTKNRYDRQFKIIIKRAILGMQKKERTSILVKVLNSYANVSTKEENHIDDLLFEYEREPSATTESDEALSAHNSDGFSEIILKIDNDTIYRMLREIDAEDLAMSLKNQNNAVREKIFSNLSKRAVSQLEEDIDYMNPESEDIIGTQIKIIHFLTKMLDAGERPPA